MTSNTRLRQWKLLCRLPILMFGTLVLAAPVQDEPLTMPLPNDVPQPPVAPFVPLGMNHSADPVGRTSLESQTAPMTQPHAVADCSPHHPGGTAFYNSSGSGSFFRWPKYVKCPPVMPPPPGDSVNMFLAIQISNGEAARMVLYHFDFVPGSPEISARGVRQLTRIAGLLQLTPHPLIIQPSPGQSVLDAQRREQVLRSLALMELHVPHERVIVQIPPARGFEGIDAEAAQMRQLGLSGSSAGTQSGQSAQNFPAGPVQ